MLLSQQPPFTDWSLLVRGVDRDKRTWLRWLFLNQHVNPCRASFLKFNALFNVHMLYKIKSIFMKVAFLVEFKSVTLSDNAADSGIDCWIDWAAEAAGQQIEANWTWRPDLCEGLHRASSACLVTHILLLDQRAVVFRKSKSQIFFLKTVETSMASTVFTFPPFQYFKIYFKKKVHFIWTMDHGQSELSWIHVCVIKNLTVTIKNLFGRISHIGPNRTHINGVARVWALNGSNGFSFSQTWLGFCCVTLERRKSSKSAEAPLSPTFTINILDLHSFKS